MFNSLLRAAAVLCVCSVVVCAIAVSPARCDDNAQARQLVEKAQITLGSFIDADEMDKFRTLLKSARGVFISPQVIRGAFIFGGSGGSGVFMVRDRNRGDWAGPAFYTIGEVSFGLQIGGDASEVIFLAMTDRGVTALLSSSVKLGADVGIAVGPVGAGADASTANLSVDILTFSRSKGLYGGASLEGAIVKVRESLNQAYYGKNVNPSDILVARTVSSGHAVKIRGLLLKAAGGGTK